MALRYSNLNFLNEGVNKIANFEIVNQTAPGKFQEAEYTSAFVQNGLCQFIILIIMFFPSLFLSLISTDVDSVGKRKKKSMLKAVFTSIFNEKAF